MQPPWLVGSCFWLQHCSPSWWCHEISIKGTRCFQLTRPYKNERTLLRGLSLLLFRLARHQSTMSCALRIPYWSHWVLGYSTSWNGFWQLAKHKIKIASFLAACLLTFRFSWLERLLEFPFVLLPLVEFASLQTSCNCVNVDNRAENFSHNVTQKWGCHYLR